MPELTIKYPGRLLNVERRTITEAQASMVRHLLNMSDLSFGDYLERVNREIDAKSHPDSEWARERREGVR